MYYHYKLINYECGLQTIMASGCVGGATPELAEVAAFEDLPLAYQNYLTHPKDSKYWGITLVAL